MKTKVEEKTKRRNLLLRVAKYGENFFPMRKASELKLGFFYRVVDAIEKETKWGRKAALIIEISLKEYLLYIGDLSTHKSKLDAILELLADDEIHLYVAVESFEERTSSSAVTCFDYKIVKAPVEEGEDETDKLMQDEDEDGDVEIVDLSPRTETD